MQVRRPDQLVDTLGLVLKAIVHTADIQDRAAVPLLLDGTAAAFPRLEHVCVDQGCTGRGTRWIEVKLGWILRVVQYPRTWRRWFIGVPHPSDAIRCPHRVRASPRCQGL